MNRRTAVSVMVLAASLLASEAMYAQPGAFSIPVNAMISKVKMVKFSMRNDTEEPIKVKAGDTEVTLEPGKLVPMKLEVGVKIVAEETTPSFAAGELISVVSTDLADSTVALK